MSVETIRIHTCNVCGKRGRWREGWEYYGSMFDEEEGLGTTICSAECKAKCMASMDDYVYRARHSRSNGAPVILNKPKKRIERSNKNDQH